MRRAALGLLVVAMACKRVETQEPEPPPKPAPTPTAVTSPTSGASTMEKALTNAAAEAPKDCKEAQRAVVPGGEAVMLRYTCAGGDLVQLVSATRVIARNFAHATLEPSVHGFWTPLGPSANFVAFGQSSCPPSETCAVDSELVPFAEGRFAEEGWLSLPYPLLPAAQTDFDHDGLPELVVPWWRFQPTKPLSACDFLTPAPPIVVHVSLDVDGLTGWSPTRSAFSSTLTSFAGWYAMRLSAARSVAKHLAARDAGACPVEPLRTAAEIALYGRVLGESPTKVDAEADALAGAIADWPKIRGQIATAGIPKLVDAR